MYFWAVIMAISNNKVHSPFELPPPPSFSLSAQDGVGMLLMSSGLCLTEEEDQGLCADFLTRSIGRLLHSWQSVCQFQLCLCDL